VPEEEKEGTIRKRGKKDKKKSIEKKKEEGERETAVSTIPS